MANKGHIKNVFPGGNTYKGFHSFYDYILPADVANRIFVIKGGPGVGKSTLMRHVGNEFVNMGYDVEFHHCSSDNNSLDGVVIKDAKIALMDGTAPHVVDPKNPGAIDEILNMGEFWNLDGMIRERDNIVTITGELKKLYNSSYHYLSAAKEMQDDIEFAVNDAVDKVKFNRILLDVKNEVTGDLPCLDNCGQIRHLFDSAITPDGVVDYVESIIDKVQKCYYIKGQHTIGSSEILNELVTEFTEKGYDVELYHQPLNPDRLQTLVVNDDKFVITVNPKAEAKAARVINLDDTIICDKLNQKADLIDKDREAMDFLVKEAARRMATAKKLHDDLEKSYIPNMNFDDITKFRDSIIKRIMDMCKK